MGILNDIKKLLGLHAEQVDFDQDIILLINAAFARLQQLGVGPTEGFFITDGTSTWATYLGSDPNLNNVKIFIFYSVKIAFDPPGTSFHLAALKEELLKLEVLINTYREGESWTDPNLPTTA